METFYGCSPLRVWNRLEVRARTQEFDQALRAEISDPLWLLGRQWQFGEFRGEDAGSPIFAKVKLSTSALVEFGPREGALSPLSNDTPLETLVERQPSDIDLSTRAQVGRHFLKLLVREAATFASGGGTPAFDTSTYASAFRAAYGFSVDSTPPSEPIAVRTAQRASDPRYRALLAALAGRAVDGIALHEAFAASCGAVPAEIELADPSHAEPILAAARALASYVTARFPTGVASYWEPSQLEYRFVCSGNSPDGRQLTLAADEYYSGTVDWYSFDVSEVGAATGGRTSHVATRIPAPAVFPGMPRPRLWEFEDGRVDLGNVSSDDTDIVKLLLSEFALVFGNNWFVIPCTQPAGSFGTVEGIVVTDVFGRRTLVLPANRTPERGWSRWDLFGLSPAASAELPPMVFVPPVVVDKLESPAIESATLVRDEATNNVWAVETRVTDGIGGHRDAAAVAREVRDYLASLSAAPATSSAVAPLKYTLANTVPAHWIPFVPVHRDASRRSIMLQRASMPRFGAAGIYPVRPLTDILRPGLANNDSQGASYFVNEEEVPEAGIVVSSSYQRARWYDGSVHIWLGRQKELGRGLGSSGLKFDIVEKSETG